MKGPFYLAPLLLLLGCGYSADPGVNQIQLAIYTQECIDVLGASTASGAEVQVYPCGAGKRSQEWSVVPVDAQGDVVVINLNSSMCMAVDPASVDAPGERVIQQTCSSDNSALNQQWKLTPQVDDPGTRFVSLASQQCLDVPYGETYSTVYMQQYFCTDDDPAQGWVVNPVVAGNIP
jgi:hypothetical protein